jgi:hypothetical protein
MANNKGEVKGGKSEIENKKTARKVNKYERIVTCMPAGLEVAFRRLERLHASSSSPVGVYTKGRMYTDHGKHRTSRRA